MLFLFGLNALGNRHGVFQRIEIRAQLCKCRIALPFGNFVRGCFNLRGLETRSGFRVSFGLLRLRHCQAGCEYLQIGQCILDQLRYVVLRRGSRERLRFGIGLEVNVEHGLGIGLRFVHGCGRG